MKNNYFILGKACGTKETGNVYPQSTGMIKDYNYNSEDSCWKLNHKQFPEFTPNLKAFQLDKRAKQTDLISITSIYFGMLVSSKLKDLLSKFSIPNHRFYTSYLAFNNKIDNSYYFFHYIQDYSDKIDYNKTKFYLSNSFGEKKSVQIQNANEYNNYFQANNVSTLMQICADKYYFIDNFIPEYDIFQRSNIDSRTYISHRLKTALEEAHITGIEIIPTDII